MTTFFKSSENSVDNLDACLRNGTLPPKLSPSLPAWADSENALMDEDYDVPKLMLSPTLPNFNKQKIKYEKPTVIYEKTRQIGPHSYTVLHTTKSKSLKLSLLIPPRVLRQIKHKPKSLQPAPVISSNSNSSAGSSRGKQGSSSDRSDDDDKPLNKIKKTDKVTSPKRESAAANAAAKSKFKFPKAPAHIQGIEKRMKQIYTTRMKHFTSVATEKKHEADKLMTTNKNFKLAIATNISSIALFVVAFHYDDRIRSLNRMLPNENNWSSLIPYLSVVIKKLQSYINTTSNVHYSAVLGLCYQLRASVNQRIKEVVTKRINRVNRRRKAIEEIPKEKVSDKEKQELISMKGRLTNELYPNLLKAQDAMRADFLDSENHLSYNNLETLFAKTYGLSKKYQNIYFRSQTTHESMIEFFDAYNSETVNDLLKGNVSSNEDLYEKLENENFSDKYFYLPFNFYLDIQQVIGYTVVVMKEWAEKQGVEIEWYI